MNQLDERESSILYEHMCVEFSLLAVYFYFNFVLFLLLIHEFSFIRFTPALTYIDFYNAFLSIFTQHNVSNMNDEQ